MKVTAIKTTIITPNDTDFLSLLDTFLPSLKEKSIVAISSKILAISQGRIVKMTEESNRDTLAIQEADWYLERTASTYNFMITIKKGLIIGSSGIDRSNGNNHYVLWPKHIQETANSIREHLKKKHHLTYIGVLLTDSKLSPLRRGVTGAAIAHSGFMGIHNYIDTPDLFGRLMKVERSNIADSLASSAVLTMGEGKEQQPLAIIEDIPFVTFQKRNPTKKELEELNVSLDEDLYIEVLRDNTWKKGGGGE